MFIKNTAVTGFTFGLVNNSTGSPLTGAAASCWISIDGAAAASVIGISPSELSNGLYKMNFSACHLNGAIVGLGFTAASAVPTYFTLITIPASAIAASNIGGSAFDSTVFKTNAIGIGVLAASAISASNIAGSALDSTVIKSNALDGITISDPAAIATTFPQMLVQVWRRFFKKSTLTATQLKTYQDNGTSAETTQTVSDDGTTQTQGTAT